MDLKNQFNYPVPSKSELMSIYGKYPYRLSKDLTDYIDYMFRHPYNKYNKLYSSIAKSTDPNDIGKLPYLITKYYLDYPQQFGNSIENIAGIIISTMWKRFLLLHKNLRNQTYDQYYPAKLKILTIGDGKLLDLLIDEVKHDRAIYDPNKLRKTIWRTNYTEQELRYYEELDYG